MSKFVKTLGESFGFFSENPLFIVPKLVVAALYSILIVLTAGLVVDVFDAVSSGSQELLFTALLFFGATILLSIVDIFVGSMYPLMVEQVKKGKKVGLRSAFFGALKNARVVLPSLVVVELGFVLLLGLVSAPLALLALSSDGFFVLFTVVYVVAVLAIVFLFYLLYPVVVFERLSIFSSLKRSVSLSLKNRGDVAKATLLSFVFSLVSFALAFAIEFFPQEEGTMLFWVAFIIVRFFTAYVYSYLYVLNPVFYFNYAGN